MSRHKPMIRQVFDTCQDPRPGTTFKFYISDYCRPLGIGRGPLHNIIFWLMGDLAAATNKNVIYLAATVIPCYVVIYSRSHALNLLTLGNDMAGTMGVNIVATTLILLIVTSLMVSATVSYCGLVGFVGLVMPHMLRLIWGPDHRLLAPVSILGGAVFVVVCDIMARTLPSQGEMPVGVVTALIGAPLFVYLLRKADR